MQTHDFWVYWAVTIPLTLALILVWFFGSNMEKLPDIFALLRKRPSEATAAPVNTFRGVVLHRLLAAKHGQIMVDKV
jgi:hypothetical protein